MHLGSLFGIPIKLHWSFAGALALGVFWVGLSQWYVGVAITVALFGSVLLHELGHALAAKYYGITTSHITLHLLGGIAAIDRMPRNPLQELVIALAGPAVNGGLFVVFAALGWSFGSQVALMVAVMNLIMGLFNLLPAFPMDGGRVLRALLATRMGWMRASSMSIRVGTVFAWGFIALGVVLRSMNLMLLGGFLLVALAAERRRLVAMAWERASHGWTDWGSADPWGRRPKVRSFR